MINQKINKLFNFEQKIILITGSSGQIGSSFCKLFLDLGAIVYGFDKSTNKLKNKNYTFKKIDITKKKVVEENNETVEFTMLAEAKEYRKTQSIKNSLKLAS